MSNTEALTSVPRSGNRLLVLVAAACAISLLSFGVRATFGLFTAPWSQANGQSIEVFALAIAIQNICWGISQPFAGAFADKFGPWKVLAIGSLLYGLGTILTGFSKDPLSLYLTAGVLTGLGQGGASYVTVLGILGKLVPAEKRSWALGIGTAAGSLGQFAVVPVGQSMIDSMGWSMAATILGITITATVLLSSVFRGESTAGVAQGADLGLKTTVTAAFGHGSYVLLFFGFFVCGFQLAFVTTHLPAYLTAKGFAPSVGAWGIAVIGLFNVLGAYFAGVLGAKLPRRWLLSALYAGRALAIIGLISLPPSTTVLMVFCASMGLLWLSTVPLTSGLLALMFGTRYLATLFGIIFFGHQIGSFLGAWLGGYIFARTGNYDLMWWLSALLGFAAAIIHMPIRERVAPRFAEPSPT